MKVKKSLMMLMFLAVCPWFFAAEAEEFKVGDSPTLNLSNVSGDITVVAGSAGKIIVDYERKDDRIDVIFEETGDTVTVRTEYPKEGGNYRGGVDFQVTFPVQGTLNIESVSGSIQVTGVSGELHLKCVSGDVTLGDSEGDLNLSSVSGDLAMDGIGAARIDGSTVSGTVSYNNGNLQDGPYKFSSTSGSIRLHHGSSASYQITGKTISGSINNNVGDMLTVTKPKYGPTSSLSGSFNGGDASVSVNTVSGGITVKLD